MTNFTKLTSIGNDYIIVENTNNFPTDLCDRHLGIGADGIINILPSNKADYKIEVFNSQLQKEKFSTNALICSAKYYHDKFNLTLKTIHIETSNGIKKLDISTDPNFVAKTDLGRVTLAVNTSELNTNRNIIYNYKLYLSSLSIDITCVRVNYPHVIIFKGDLFKLKYELKDLVYDIQNSNLFKVKPFVSFVNLKSFSQISVETFNPIGEEILSCAESAVASVYSCIHHFKTDHNVNVNFKKGICNCTYDKELEHFIFTSTASTIFEGSF